MIVRTSRTLRNALGAAAALAAIGAVSPAAQAQGHARALLRGQRGMVPRRWSPPSSATPASRSSMTRKSSGEIYAQVKAEAANPRGDIWWGGTGDPHMQAAEEGLTARIQVARTWTTCRTGRCGSGSSRRTAPSASIRARSASATTPRRSPRRRAAGAEMLGRPARRASCKDEVQVADPNSSGTVLHDARHHRSADGRGEGLRVPQGPAQEHQPVHQVGRRAGQGDGARRDGGRHHLHARHDHDGGATARR